MPNPKTMAAFGLSFITVLFVLMICVMLAGCANVCSTTVYRLPNGVKCSHKDWYQQTVEFYGCFDGKKYYNPAWVEEVSACEP